MLTKQSPANEVRMKKTGERGDEMERKQTPFWRFL
jgi:hypothetical protein